MKAFKITYKDQFIQDIKLSRGTYTFHAWVLAMGSNYSIGLKTQSGAWLNFNMADQIKAGEWRKVKLTFTIYDPCVQFSLMNSFASGAAYVIVAAPMLEEGSNAGTQKPNELDLDESINDTSIRILLSNESHLFAGSETAALAGSTIVNIEAYRGTEKITLAASDIVIDQSSLPTGMTRTIYFDGVVFDVTTAMTSASGEIPIKIAIGGVIYTRNFSYAISFKGADGLVKDIRLEASTQIIRKLKSGTWNPSTPVTVTATAINTAITKWEYSVNGGAFSESPPIGVTRSGNVVSINPNAGIAYALYTIRASDGTISDTISVIRLEDGTDGVKGDPGAAGITLLLSNESHIFAGSTTAALAGSTYTDIIAYRGSTPVTPTSIEVGTKPTGMTSSVSGSRVTFSVTTAMTTAEGTVPISVVIDGVTYPLTFSYCISFKGAHGAPGTDGEDGLSKGIYLNTATQIIKYNEAGTPTPASNFTVVGTAVNTTISTWRYSVNGGSFSSTAPAGVSRSGNTVTISPTTVTFNILSIRASDGTISDTITIAAVRDGSNGLPGKLPIMMEWVQGDTHYNNDTVVSYVYYRAGNTWWRLKDSYASRTATASPSTIYYQQLSSVEYLVTKIIIAEQGNLAGLIFKDNKLISQKGMINGVESTDYSNPAFVPNVYIDGATGEIVADKLLNPFIVSDPDITGDLQSKLTNNHNIYLEAGGQVSYVWKQHTLPGTGTLADKRLDGLNIKIYAPAGGGNHRIKIVPAGSGMIFGDVPGHVVPSLKLVMNTRDTIHLSAVWNRVYEVLDWVMTSRTSYRTLVNQGDSSEIRVPNVFKENDIIAKGDVSTSGALSNLLNRYGANIFCSVSSNTFTISIPRQTYYAAGGVVLNRGMSADQFGIEVISSAGSNAYGAFLRKYYGTGNQVTGVHFVIQFRNQSNTVATTNFKFVIRALDYVFNNPYLDDEL